MRIFFSISFISLIFYKFYSNNSLLMVFLNKNSIQTFDPRLITRKIVLNSLCSNLLKILHQLTFPDAIIVYQTTFQSKVTRKIFFAKVFVKRNFLSYRIFSSSVSSKSLLVILEIKNPCYQVLISWDKRRELVISFEFLNAKYINLYLVYNREIFLYFIETVLE